MKISIIIPNYNKEKYVIDCLNSCLNQSYKNIEVIFIDNDSSDSSLDLVKKYKIDTNTEFIIDTAQNIYENCWDECVQLAEKKYVSGDYYTIIGSDDFIHPNYVGTVVELISASKPMAFQSKLLWISNNQAIREVGYEYNDINDYKNKLLQYCCVNTPTVFYKKDFKTSLQIKTDPIRYSGAADYELFCQAADKNIVVENFKHWIGYYYRINNDQATWQMHKSKINYDKIIQKKWRDKWMS